MSNEQYIKTEIFKFLHSIGALLPFTEEKSRQQLLQIAYNSYMDKLEEKLIGKLSNNEKREYISIKMKSFKVDYDYLKSKIPNHESFIEPVLKDFCDDYLKVYQRYKI